jgi:hypothetical protein
MKLLKFLYIICGFYWIAVALEIVFNDYQLSEFDAICSCVITAVFFFLLTITTVEVTSDDR